MRAALFSVYRSAAKWTALCGGETEDASVVQFPAHAALRNVEAALAALATETPELAQTTDSVHSRTAGNGKATKQRRRKLNRKVWEIVQSDEYRREAAQLGHSVPEPKKDS